MNESALILSALKTDYAMQTNAAVEQNKNINGTRVRRIRPVQSSTVQSL